MNFLKKIEKSNMQLVLEDKSPCIEVWIKIILSFLFDLVYNLLLSSFYFLFLGELLVGH